MNEKSDECDLNEGSVRIFTKILKTFPEFFESISQYLADRSFFIKKYQKKLKKFSINFSFVKAGIIQKFYWGRGQFYRPFISGFVISLFVFTFVLLWFLDSSHATDTKSTVGTVQAAQNASVTNSFLSDTTSVPNLTSSSIKSGKSGLINWVTVQNGDTLASIAKKYNTTVDVIKWANNLTSDNVTVGESLEIVPVSGITYKFQSGDTLASVATEYKSSVSEIEDWNLLNGSGTIQAGETIFIPNGVIPQPKVQVYSSFASVTNPSYSPYSGLSFTVNNTSPYSFYFSQLDSRWKYNLIGYSYDTVGADGCLVTDIAMTAKYYNINMSPASIASNPYNFEGPLFNWNGLGVFNVVPLGNMWNGYVNWSAVNSELESGHPVVVGIGYDYHYVLLVGITSNGEYIMNDPARGADLIFNNYYNPAYVTQAVLFTPY